MPQPARKKILSHVDRRRRPTMVDIGAKAVTRRTAVAEAVVRVPTEVARLFRNGEAVGPKGPVLATAIIAGTQAVKDTARLIPFCHPLPIDRCTFDIAARGRRIRIRCTVSAEYKTGVEMEALTGATVAALTLYDMCKAISHDMVVEQVALVRKTGGKSDLGAA